MNKEAERMSLDTAAVVKRHLDALMARDVEALVGDYSDDAFFITNLSPEPVRGKLALTAFWTGALSVFTPEVVGVLEFTAQVVEGEIAYITWHAGDGLPFGSDTFLVRGGQIVAQTGAILVASTS